MPTDKIMSWPDYAEDRNPAFTLPKAAMRSYRAYLTYLYEQNFGEAIPPIPDAMPSTPVHVNVGAGCGNAKPAALLSLSSKASR